VPDLARQTSERYGRTVETGEIEEFCRFLAASRLTLEQPGGWRELDAAANAQQGTLLQQALHNYLFFKLPLVQPAAFLERTLPLVRGLASRGMLVLFAVLSGIGLYFVSRQWGDFSDGLQRQMNISGAMLFAATLFVMKVFHELGHAYVATAMGCRVRSMGLAVMLMAPMLYTDVTNAWLLPQRRKRIAIDIAGVAVELVIAGLALLAWAFIAPGDARDVALVIATAAVAMTLAINLSPFMRFDGYYIFADLIAVKNLQPRAFALVRWTLREWLFRLDAPCPDSLRGGLRMLVIAYGIATMLYRLVLFTGIALVVYHMFFKLLGIALFLVEIIVFVLRPIWREFRVWWNLRKAIRWKPRFWGSTTALAALLLALVLPWSRQVQIPAVMEPAAYARLYPSVPAEVQQVQVVPGQQVKAGDILVVLSSPRLEKEMSVARMRLALVEERIARRMGDAKDMAATLLLEKDSLSLIEKTAALQRQIDSLSIRAPLDGRIAELDPNLHAGRLLARDEEIGVIVGGNEAVIRGYADQQDIWRVKPGDTASFVADATQLASVPAYLATIALSTSASIDILQLAETHGGRLRTQPVQAKSPLVPLDPVTLVTFLPMQTIDYAGRSIRGVVLIDAAPQSIAAGVWRRALKILIQETSV
jgi:putative peptide zinc metalloprotease protein